MSPFIYQDKTFSSLFPILYTVDSYGMLAPLLHETFLPLMMLALSVAPSDPGWPLDPVHVHARTERKRKITVKCPYKAYKASLLSVGKCSFCRRKAVHELHVQ